MTLLDTIINISTSLIFRNGGLIDVIMDYLDNQLLLEVTIAEIFICLFFASAGFTLRVLINRGSSTIRELIKKSFVESIVVIGSAVIISLMINPFIEVYSKRLVALAPFILGIIGMDFVKHLLS